MTLLVIKQGISVPRAKLPASIFFSKQKLNKHLQNSPSLINLDLTQCRENHRPINLVSEFRSDSVIVCNCSIILFTFISYFGRNKQTKPSPLKPLWWFLDFRFIYLAKPSQLFEPFYFLDYPIICGLCLSLFLYHSNKNVRNMKTHIDYVFLLESLSTDPPARGERPSLCFPPSECICVSLCPTHCPRGSISRRLGLWGTRGHTYPTAWTQPTAEWPGASGDVSGGGNQGWIFSLGKCTRCTWTTHFLLQTNCFGFFQTSSKIKVIFFESGHESA